ncbi:MAG TPA: RNA polymerase sigma-70 factor [Gemmatimonadales bacterium]|nr:RNA polymerase sigma-70 factor [Gemmatimonadales bacterium]
MQIAHAVQLDDTDLIARIRDGDESAYEQLFRRYYPELCRYAARIAPDPSSAEELVQEVFSRVWLRHARLPDVQSLAAYLYTAVRNYALNQRQRSDTAERWRHTKWVELLDEGAAAPSADERVRAAELAAAIEHAIEELPPRCREVFILRRRQGLSTEETARAMHITPKTVEIQIGNALKALRKALADWI